ncbi:chemotaxis protein CheB [Desertivirga xinjiangensis]|uniref:chemotaxis protein CheB n=1 Tax=Desertivirga xinjiangensis TaxID=539206 RepID=UPI00210CAF61|nr:chemotaxis protein CheB [Pedobacter xinjiangensis]
MLNLTSNILDKILSAEALLIGCSAGGFNLVYELVSALPAEFPLPVVVIIHRSRRYKSSIEELLDTKSQACVKLAEDKEVLKKGIVYFAPPDYHLLLEPEGCFSLDSSEPVLFSRPSIDVTFKSVSDVYKQNVIAMLFSGANEDGAEGLCYIRDRGGLIVIQDPKSAEVRRMPEAALNKCRGGLVLDNVAIHAFFTSITSCYK